MPHRVAGPKYYFYLIVSRAKRGHAPLAAGSSGVAGKENNKEHGRSKLNRTMLQAKLHRVRVTQACLDYEGSCGIDEELLEFSGILPNQYIEIYNVSNGERFCTYAIKGQRHSGEISLNGAAARKAEIGDILIICAYSSYSEAELATHEPVVVLIDEHNRAREVIRAVPALAKAS
jgi:aspartate 1-decarboxylase